MNQIQQYNIEPPIDSQSQQSGDTNISVLSKKLEYLKINGFTRNFHTLQITSYIFFLIDILFFTFYILPLVSNTNTLKILAGLLYYLSVTLIIYYGYYCTYIDPTDEVVIYERKCRKNGTYFPAQNYDFFCNTCQTHCQEFSKHCKQCDRCVEGFDHHCKWLNNCIGSKNYRQFAILILFVFFNLIVYLVFSIYVACRFSSENYKQLDSRFFIETNSKVYVISMKIINIILLVLNAIFLILDANLLGFHLYLKQKGLSTYDYIINKRIEVSNKKGRPKSPMRQKQNNTVVDICCGNKKIHQKNKISQIHAIPSEADSQRSQYQQRSQEILPQNQFNQFYQIKECKNNISKNKKSEFQLSNNFKTGTKQKIQNSYPETERQFYSDKINQLEFYNSKFPIQKSFSNSLIQKMGCLQDDIDEEENNEDIQTYQNRQQQQQGTKIDNQQNIQQDENQQKQQVNE